jgi:hypothetical protein
MGVRSARSVFEVVLSAALISPHPARKFRESERIFPLRSLRVRHARVTCHRARDQKTASPVQRRAFRAIPEQFQRPSTVQRE